MLVPLFNILQVMKNAVTYNNIRSNILDHLSVMNCLQEMTDIEKEEYLKKPTGFNALTIPFKLEIRLLKATTIKIDKDNETSEFYYEMGESIDNITILKVSGPASRLTVEEQKEKIIEALKTAVQAGIEKYGDVESLINVLRNNSNIDLSIIKEDKKEEEIIPQHIQEININEKIQAFENLKNELLNEHEEAQSTQTDNGFQKTNKLKK